MNKNGQINESAADTHNDAIKEGSAITTKLGNAFLYGSLATGGAIAYSQYAYSVDNLENILEEYRKESNSSENGVSSSFCPIPYTKS